MRRLRWYHIPLALVALILVAILAQTLHVMLALRASAPRLEGQIAAQVSAPVSVARDAEGVPTLTAGSQADLAYAIGYLHAQERFFQMDQLRRVGAGELSELLGPPTLDIDRKLRVHRFRDRARAELGRMTPWERAVLDAYVAGVNSGLRALGSAPFEYAALLAKPEPWLAEDSLLTAYAMYFDLQGVAPTDELKIAAAARKLGAAMTEFLFPAGTALDSAIDGSLLPEPPMPESIQSSRAGPAVQAPLQDPAEAPTAAMPGRSTGR
ncbi:penicillin acylase family protein [Hankyongella ginsenosidimutans]|uniref:Penicillin acylase family protein n=1 Tax=Hankyongella ginsenosidimutans TaxID=1763828 RepID=A0A4D7C7H4_9SPHN|nr:penicillin acylase family protein [Hankyongella ginsenosidimutans]QCI80000.1 penicillin acylase family protein [Hankyongella ginsenosidimutans]